jgi:hypothetical protein
MHMVTQMPEKNKYLKKQKCFLLALLSFSLLLLYLFEGGCKRDGKSAQNNSKSDLNRNVTEAKWYEYEPSIVSLKGVLKKQIMFEAPNYGEDPATDEKVACYILQLSTHINVKTDPNSEVNTDTFENVKDIQITTFKDLGNALSKWIGRKVEVKGELFQGFTGHHHTDVLIVAEEIRLLNNDQ